MRILLAIGLPLVGGLALFLKHGMEEKKRRIYLEALCLLTTVLVWVCLLTWKEGVFTLYHFSGGFSIDFGVDGMTKLFAGMVSLMWPLVMLYAFEYMKHDKWTNSFFAFYVMTYGITLAVAFSASILTLYVFFEMLTLITVPLVTHYRNHESMWAGRSYAYYLIGGAALGFAPVVVLTLLGNEGIFAFGGSITGAYDPHLLRILYLFGFFGFGVKAAIFPLHLWLPRASVAPTPVTALLHAVAVVNSGVFAVGRLIYYSIGPEVLSGSYAQYISVLMACFTLVYAAVEACRERHFKRRLAYSTVSNLSYMLFGLCLMTPAGMVGGLSHMLFHGIFKMTLFLCAGAFMHLTGDAYVYQLDGVGKRMPVTFACYTLAGLSLVGLPLFCGFISKWSLLEAGRASGTWDGTLGVFCLILSAVLCAIYTLVPAVRACFPRAGKDRFLEKKLEKEPLLMTIPMVVFVIVNFVFGIWPGPIMGFLEKLAQGYL